MGTNESEVEDIVDVVSPETGQLVMATLAAIISCTSTILNVVVLLTLATTASLRRLNNSAITSLAVADLVRAVTIMPLYVALLTTDHETWPLPGAVCPVYTALVVASVAAVVFNCALIGAERAFVITAPLTYNRFVTRPRLAAVIILTWAVSILFGVLHSVGSAEDSQISSWSVDGRQLTTAYCLTRSSISVAVIKVIIFFVIPLIIIVISYVIISWVVRGQMHRITPTPSSLPSELISTDVRRFSMSTATTSTGPSTQLPPVTGTQGDDAVRDARHLSSMTSQRSARRLAADVIYVQPCADVIGDAPQRACHVINEVAEDESSGRGGATSPAVTEDQGTDAEHRQCQPSRSGDELPAVSSLRRTLSDAALSHASTDDRHRRKNSTVTFNLDTDQVAGATVTSASTLPRQVHPPYSRHPAAAAIRRSASLSAVSTAQHQSQTTQQPTCPQQRASVSSVHSRSPRRCSVLECLGENKAVRMSLVVVGAFIVCWLPSSVCYLLRTTSTDSGLVSDMLWDAVSLVALTASTLDSLIYNFYSAEFRRAAHSTLLAPCRRQKSLPPFN